MPPNGNFGPFGDSARNLAGSPVPRDVSNDMAMMRATTGQDVENLYGEVLQKTIDIGDDIDRFKYAQEMYARVLKIQNEEFATLDDNDSVDQIVRKIEDIEKDAGRNVSLSREIEIFRTELMDIVDREAKNVEATRQTVSNQRKEIQEAISQNPEMENFMRRHQQEARKTQIENSVRGMEDQDLYDELDQKNLLNPQDKAFLVNNPAQARGAMEQNLIGQKTQEDRQSQFEELTHVRTARNANRMRSNMPSDRFDQELKSLVSQGRITSDEAEPYMGGQNREEFLNKYGPFLAGGYVSRKMNSDSGTGGPGPTPPSGLPPLGQNPPNQPPTGGGVGGQGGPTGPGGPLPPGVGPIEVRVTNLKNDAVWVRGDAGGSGAGGSGGVDGNRPRDEAAEQLKMDQVVNLLSGLTGSMYDLAKPGGGAIGAAVPGMLSMAGTRALPLLRAGGMGAAGLGVVGAGVGMVAGGATAAHEGAQYQQSIEAQFGENQSRMPFTLPGSEEEGFLQSDMFQAQIGARIENIMLTGQEVEGLTEQLAKLGATAEEASEMLGPAADALDEYKILNEESAARAARRGQAISPIGAREANVLGAVMEKLSGGGFSTDAINQAAQTSAETYEPMGVPLAEYGGLGLVNLLQSGDASTDMALEQSGTVQSSIEMGGRIAQSPVAEGMKMNAILAGGSIGTDYTQLNIGTPEGRARANFSLIDTVMTLAENQGFLDTLIRDKQGQVDALNPDNIEDVELGLKPMVDTAAGRDVPVSEILNVIRTTQGSDGEQTTEEAFQQTLDADKLAEETRTKELENIGGALQKEQVGKTSQQGLAAVGDFYSTPMGKIASPAMAVIEPFASAATNLLTGKNAFERGEAGSFAAADEWAKQDGGYMGTILSTEGKGFGDTGINPDDVTVKGKGEKQWTLAEVQEDKKLLEQFEAGSIQAEVDVGGKPQLMKAADLATAVANEELKYESGIRGKGLTMGDDAGGSGEGPQLFDLTERAAQLLRPADARDPHSPAGATTNAQNALAVGSGKSTAADAAISNGYA